MPHWSRELFRETREFWRNVRIVNDVVMEIIGKKREQLQECRGLFRFVINDNETMTLTCARKLTRPKRKPISVKNSCYLLEQWRST